EDVAVRRPVIARRSPDEAGPDRLPETRLPDVTSLTIQPHAWRVEAVVIGRRHRWAVGERRGRLRQIGNLRLILRRPEAGHPAPAVRGLLPVALDVPFARRRVAVGPTDPDVLVAFGVPGPVTVEPLHVRPFGRLRRRFLGNGRRWRLGHERAGFGL